MKKMMISPSKYVQGAHVLSDLGIRAAAYGKRAILIAHPSDYARVSEVVSKSFEAAEIEWENAGFCGECTRQEIDRVTAMAQQFSAAAIIGLGGGKALDTAKAAAINCAVPMIVVPTIASTDAPCSSLSVVYTDSGEFEAYSFYHRNPDLVLVDSAIIAKAPVRFLIAGMGDALATYFEARACERAFAKNIPGGHSTKSALAIARLCYDTLLEDSWKAKQACEAGVATQALENIIEANILMSGLGFESSGLAAAHAVHNGLTVLPQTHAYYHGEKVAFGVIVQLVMENAPSVELNAVLAYCRLLGLPTCLADLGIHEANATVLRPVAELSCAAGDTMGNMPFPVTVDDVVAAIIAADRIGGSR